MSLYPLPAIILDPKPKINIKNSSKGSMFMTSMSNSKLRKCLTRYIFEENSIKCDNDFNTTESHEETIQNPTLESYRNTYQTSEGNSTNRFKRVTLSKDKAGKDALIQYLMKNGINMTKNEPSSHQKLSRSSVNIMKGLTARQSSTQSVPEEKENVNTK